MTTIAIGLLPTFQASSTAAALRGAGSGATASQRMRRARQVLAAAEVAVSVVLLVGASLLGRSLVRLLQTDIGVTIHGVSAALIDVSFGRQLSMAEQRYLIERVVEHVGRLPGVTSVGAGASMPPNLARLRFTMNRFNDASGEHMNYMVDAVAATPGYFTTLGIRLRGGRFFDGNDGPESQQVMIVSASTARQLFGNRDAIGRTVDLPMVTPRGTRAAPITVVGVVDDVRYSGIDTPPHAVIYRPFAQQPWPSMFIVTRTADRLQGFTASLRRQMTGVDPDIGILSVDSLDSLVSSAVAPQRFQTVVLLAVAALAIALAAVGLYGVVTYVVAQRTAEIGIRLALGAGRDDVIRLVFREGLWMIAVGLAVGMAVALGFRGLIANLLYEVAPTDPLSYVGGAMFLFTIAALATYLPARRASHMDPLVALRYE